MKRMLAILLTLALLACTAAAVASGLPTLENTLPPVQMLAPLPDPGVSLGQAGQLYQSDFEYENGTVYDTYLYAKPATLDDFIAAYKAAAEEAGYTVTEGAESGNKALLISDGNEKAILLVDYQGYMFFMVPKGLDFVLAATVEATPAPELKYNYMSMDYNGRHYESLVNKTNARRSTILGQYDQFFSFRGAPFDTFMIFWPDSAVVGNKYTVRQTDGSTNGPDSSVAITVYQDDTRLINNSRFWLIFYSNGLDDYFTLTITRAEETEYGFVYEGTFEGKMGSDSDKPIVIENGFFTTFVP